MNNITADLTLGFTDDNGRQTIFAKQYDTMTRKIHIVFEDDETAYAIETDVTHIFLKEQFADKSLLTPYQITDPEWSEDRKEMTFTLIDDMLRVPGVAKCELVFLHCTNSPIFNEDGTLESSDAIVLTTQSFNIYIEPSVSYGGSMSAAQQNFYDNMIAALVAAQRMADYDQYVLKTDIASTDTVGVIRIGSGLTIDANGVLSATGGGGGGGGKMLNCTLLQTGWENNEQTVAVQGVTPDCDGVMGLPITNTKEENDEYVYDGIRVSNIGTDEITFQCEHTPTMDFSVLLLIAESGGGGGGGGSDYIPWDHVTNKPTDLVQDPNYTHTDNNFDNTSKTIVDNVTNDLFNKVDKVIGKGLSTNDYTNAEKSKLASLVNYTLPTASGSVLGGVKIGDGLEINASGVVSVTPGGTTTVDWDHVTDKPEGLVIDPDYVHYVLPIASPTTLGGIKLGSGLVIDLDGVVSVDASGATIAWGKITNKPADLVQDAAYQHTDFNYDSNAKTVVDGLQTGFSSGKRLSTNDYTNEERTKLANLSNYVLPAATTSTLGGVKVGGGLSVAYDGTIKANLTGVIVTESNGIITDSNGNLKLTYADRNNYGAVKIGDGINVTNGVISAQQVELDPSSAGGLTVNQGRLATTTATSTDFGVMKLGTGLEIDSETGGVNVVPTALQSVDWASVQNIPDNLVYDEDYVHTDENYTAVEKAKLAAMKQNVYWEDVLNKPSSFYTLPTASASVLGGVKIGAGLSIDANGVLSSSGGTSFVIVNSVSDIDPTAPDAGQHIYLVPKQGSQSDVYDEYIVVQGQIEHIGSTEIDLSNYPTKDEVDAITGDLDDLETTEQGNLVGAINEVNELATDYVFTTLEDMETAIEAGLVPEGGTCYVMDDFIDASSTDY